MLWMPESELKKNLKFNPMTIKQLSIFLENKSGRLTEVLETLGKEKINVTALTIADTSEYGILRMIVSNPDKAHKLLKEKGFSVNLADVLSIATPIEAGSFAKVLRIFSDENISIEYMYAFAYHEKGVIVMRTDDRQKAFKVIEKKKMKIVSLEDIFGKQLS
jgi:hypothetical protein